MFVPVDFLSRGVFFLCLFAQLACRRGRTTDRKRTEDDIGQGGRGQDQGEMPNGGEYGAFGLCRFLGSLGRFRRRNLKGDSSNPSTLALPHGPSQHLNSGVPCYDSNRTSLGSLIIMSPVVGRKRIGRLLGFAHFLGMPPNTGQSNVPEMSASPGNSYLVVFACPTLWTELVLEACGLSGPNMTCSSRNCVQKCPRNGPQNKRNNPQTSANLKSAHLTIST